MSNGFEHAEVEFFARNARFEGVDVKQGLVPLRSLLGRMSSPQLSFPSVVVGGTNGKGSVVAMLASILAHTGLLVGTYTSPHLFRLNERISVGAKTIDDAALLSLVKAVRAQSSEGVSWFEFVTAMAFEHFRQSAVDIAVLEVGMGGRLDATNVVPAAFCAITNVSLDHQEYLGKSIAAIAYEKAGIIKPGSVCVTGERNGEALEIISSHTQKMSATLLCIDRDFSFEERETGMVYHSKLFAPIEGIKLSLRGRHQRDNALCAITLALCLGNQYHDVPPLAIREGLQKCSWRGRFDVLAEKPTVVFDGAHNAAGMCALVATLREEFPGREIIAIMGFLRGKDYRGMLRTMATVASRIIIVAPDSPRALSPQEIINECGAENRHLESSHGVAAALRRALAFAKSGEEVICFAGSLFLAAPLKNLFTNPHLGFAQDLRP